MLRAPFRISRLTSWVILGVRHWTKPTSSLHLTVYVYIIGNMRPKSVGNNRNLGVCRGGFPTEGWSGASPLYLHSLLFDVVNGIHKECLKPLIFHQIRQKYHSTLNFWGNPCKPMSMYM